MRNPSNTCKAILQLSIPFCFKQCSYCDYPYCAYDPKVLRAYVKAMLREIESAAQGMEEYEITAISIEGGSPSLVTADGLQEILRAVRTSFTLADEVQISLQTMPGEYSRALMEKMRDAGVNHWIIGLQTAQMKEHELLDRPYHFDAITMVDMAILTFHPRDLSFDLLYGIPGQTLHSWMQTLERSLAYEPEHMTLSPLTLKRGTGLRERVHSGELSPVSSQELEAFREAAAELLLQHGLKPYTIYDYAKTGKENRFKLGVLKGCERLGIGYRAVTLLDGVTYTNGHSLQEYLEHSDDPSVIANNVVRLDEAQLAELRSAAATVLSVGETPIA